MKSVIISLIVLVCFTATTNAQTTNTLKKVMELSMPGESGGQDGTRGASVTYNPVLKKYYAAFAGNINYPMAVFDIKGKMISGDSLKTNADLRGLWYNPVTKTLQGNCYADGGWVNYKLNAKGIPLEPTKLLDSTYQPDDQSVGAFDAKTKTVYFIKFNSVIAYNMKGLEGKSHQLLLPDSEDEFLEDELPEKYNYSTVIFTALPKREFGIYNTDDRKIELYNRETGENTSNWQLPDDAPNAKSFNLAYCNNMLWLFDMDARIWYAYK